MAKPAQRINYSSVNSVLLLKGSIDGVNHGILVVIILMSILTIVEWCVINALAEGALIPGRTVQSCK